MKYFFHALAALILIIVIGLTSVVLLVDPNQFKEEIANTVQERTGRTVKITGDLELSVFPWIGLQTGPVELGNAPGFGPEPFLKVDSVEIRVKLLPLLAKRLEVKRVVLEGLALNLAKAPSGRTNWQDLAAKGKSEERQPATPKAEKPRLAALTIGGIALKDGVIVWRDLQAGKALRFDHVNIHIGELRFDEATDVSLGFVLHLQEPAFQETLALEGQLIVDEQLQRLELHDLQLQSLSEGKVIPSGRLQAFLNTSRIVVDRMAQTLAIEDLRLKAAKAVLSGNLSAQAILEKPKVTGALRLQAPLRDTLAELDSLPQTADPKALSQLELAFKLVAGVDDVALDDLQGTLDDTHWRGQVAVVALANPHVRFQLDIDAIDMDRYLPQQSPQSSASTVPPKAAVEPPLPLAMLAAQKLDGHVHVGRLKIKNLRLEDVTLNAKGRNSVLTLEPRVAHFYQGAYQGRIRIDGRSAIPSLVVSSQMQQVAVGDLLRDYRDQPALLSGSAFLNLNLQGRGQTLTALKRSLNGKVAFQIKDGSLNNLEFLKLIKQGEAWWTGKSSRADQIDRLSFVTLDFLASVRNGIVQTDRFLIDSRKLRVEGKGSIDLVREDLDYTLRAVRLKHKTGRSGQKIALAKGMPIIIKISGPLDKPEYMLDVVQMAKEKYRGKIEQKLEKKLGPAAGQLLKGLFGQ